MKSNFQILLRKDGFIGKNDVSLARFLQVAFAAGAAAPLFSKFSLFNFHKRKCFLSSVLLFSLPLPGIWIFVTLCRSLSCLRTLRLTTVSKIGRRLNFVWQTGFLLDPAHKIVTSYLYLQKSRKKSGMSWVYLGTATTTVCLQSLATLWSARTAPLLSLRAYWF